MNSYDLFSTTVPYPERDSTKTFLENKRILQCARNFKAFCCLKVHNAHLQLASSISR